MVVLFSLLLTGYPIAEVGFTGNNSVSVRHLRAEVISKVGEEYADLNVRYDIDRIIRFYSSQGFFSTSVMPTVTVHAESAFVVFEIEEGSRPRIEEIRVTGDSLPDLRRYLCVRKGEPFIESRLSETVRAIEEHFKDRGYPFADVEDSAIPDSGILIIRVEKGDLCYVRNVEVRGLTRAKPLFVRREVELKYGDLYSKSKVYDSQRRIYALGYFGTLNVEIARVAPDTIDLIFELKELRSRILNFGAGVSLPFSFLVSVGLEELNLANLGHRVNIAPLFKINIEKEWEAKVEARYTLPHVTPLGLQLSALPFM